MNPEKALHCVSCQHRDCVNGGDCVADADRQRKLYEVENIARLHRAASAIEARHYCREPRIREVILFARELNVNRLGLAFCVGLSEEAEVVADILGREFEVLSVCCKVCGIDKESLGLEQIDPRKPRETMCNPVGQAVLLNEAGTQLNVLVGLCVGHDALFTMTSRAPVTTLICKDRTLAHNPAGAIYSRYLRRRLLSTET